MNVSSQAGQIAVWPTGTEAFFDSVEYDDEERAAYQWWPLGKKRPVLLDTRMNAGRPSTSQTGIRTIAIRARAERGWASKQIGADLGALPDEIDAALELEHIAA